MQLSAEKKGNPISGLKVIFTDAQTSLTFSCGLFLGLSFIPRADFLAYASVASGAYFAIKSAWDSIRAKELDVNILMVLAAVGAIVVGQVQDAAALLFLFSLSSTLEAFAMAKTKAAIEKLVQLRPTTALLVRDGKEERVPVESLLIGDRILIPSFEKIPLDGNVTEGGSSVDESALTGESVAIAKSIGSRVVAGTQNLEGTLTIAVTHVVGDSTLDQIIAMVQQAQENKASGEKLSQWFGQRYTIFVLVAFALSWAIRMQLGEESRAAFYSALILLVGLSPCALVISTPASTLSALAKAARSGILVRGGEFIEKVADIDVIAMDKTGTLTQGKPVLVAVAHEDATGQLKVWKPGESVAPELSTLLADVAGVERLSSHPLAKAIVVEAERNKIAPSDVSNSVTHPGLGVSATVQTTEWLVGNDTFLEGKGFKIPAELVAQALAWKVEGRTTVFAHGGGTFGVFALGDTVRPEAAQVVQDLLKLGVKKVVMLTGDKLETALAIAKTVGITEVHAGLLPADKTRLLEEFSKNGHSMMVGDGVNDAPSLALATVGVAMGGLGSDVALEAADVVLMRDNLKSLPELVLLGRRTRGVIRANLIFAFGMILVLASASFLIKLPLPIAVLGHEGSTVLVILNGLRLLK